MTHQLERGKPVGIARRTAYALSVFPLDIVHRQTIRMMLPPGGIRYKRSEANWLKIGLGDLNAKKSLNKASANFGAALKKFSDEGWIDRGREFLRIRERGDLLDYAVRDLAEMPDHFIELDRAIALLEQETTGSAPAPQSAEQRRRELLAIQQLMKAQVQGVHWSGRGSIRFVPKGRAL